MNYKQDFEDILASVSEKDEDEILQVLVAFEEAIDFWIDHHETALKKYRDLHGRFLTMRRF